MMNFKIGELHRNAPHLFTDLAELLLLIDFGGRGYLHRNDIETLLTSGTISHEEIDNETEEDRICSSSAERNSRIEIQLDNIMAHLEYRARALSSFYPFRVEGEKLIRQEALNSQQRVYRLLLACSRLGSFENNGIRQQWARNFTLLSKIAMTGLLPHYAEVRIFDANSEDRKAYYSTDLREALKVLGKDLGVVVNEAECNKRAPQGDAGLDLVGVVNFDDGAATSFAILGQCGAQGTGWPKKTLEAHSIHYRHLFHMQFDYPCVMFTPICFRTTSGEWVDNRSANGIFLADRNRILKLLDLQNKCEKISELPWFFEFERKFATTIPPD